MVPRLLAGEDVRHISYTVRDVRTAVASHAAIFGSGPFFLSAPPFVVAIGQWSHVQVEFTQKAGALPSDSDGASASRYNHICLHPTDIDATIEKFAQAGHRLRNDIRMRGGSRSVVVDTTTALGYDIELWERTEEVGALCSLLWDAAQGFDGSDLIRPLPERFGGG
jgi:hypothetical protein